MVSKKAKERWANTYRGRRSPLPLDHIGHLDLRVGIVREVMPNPRASHKYFLTTVNFGKIFSLVVGAMLVHHYEEEELIDRMVVCCCNIRPAWTKGSDSYTNMLVACSPDLGTKHELLIPPDGAEPGDIITVPEYPRDPDTPYFDPKSGIWEAIELHTKVNERGHVLYKSKLWIIENKPGYVHTVKNFNSFLRVV